MTTTNLSRTSLFGTDWKEVDDAEWKALDDDEYESEEEVGSFDIVCFPC